MPAKEANGLPSEHPHKKGFVQICTSQCLFDRLHCARFLEGPKQPPGAFASDQQQEKSSLEKRLESKDRLKEGRSPELKLDTKSHKALVFWSRDSIQHLPKRCWEHNCPYLIGENQGEEDSEFHLKLSILDQEIICFNFQTQRKWSFLISNIKPTLNWKRAPFKKRKSSEFERKALVCALKPPISLS